MDPLGIDITKVAVSFSTFAGVLAGFVFAVIGYLLSARPQHGAHGEKRDDTLDPALSWSILAFVMLSVAAFLFALESGEDRFSAGVATPRSLPLALHIVASGVLTAAILTLLLAINWLFSNENSSPELLTLLRLVIYLTGLMTIYYFDSTFGYAARDAGQSVTIDGSLIFLLTCAAASAIMLGELLGFFLRRGSRAARLARSATQFLLLLATFACAGLFYLMIAQNDAAISAWNPPSYEYSGVAALAAILFLLTLNLPHRRAPGEL
jgi:hypothetical protein